MIDVAPEPSGRNAFDAFLRRLQAADWEKPNGPLRLNADLRLAELGEADLLINARVLLGALAESGGAPATATGNLNRAFVRGIFGKLELPKRVRNSINLVCKTFNEQEVWPLHLVRVICESSGLAARRKKQFQLTKLGKAMLAEDQAGLLYRQLFLGYFRRFNLHYDFPLRQVPGIQETMAFILWRLDTLARDWTPVKGLARQVLLPGVLRQLHAAMSTPYDKEEWILDGYVLVPLCRLGLLHREKRGEAPSPTEGEFIRVSALWPRFITFEDRMDGGGFAA